MSAEMAVFSSPWQGDAWLSRDFLRSDDPSLSDDSLSSLSHHSSASHRQTVGSSLLDPTRCSPSLGGSECSEDLLLDDEDDLPISSDDQFGNTFSWGLDPSESDLMQQTMMSILGENVLATNDDDDLVVSLDLPELQLPKLPSSKSQTSESKSKPQKRKSISHTPAYESSSDSTIPSLPSSPQVQCKKTCRRKTSNQRKPWNDLSTSEKLSVAEELSINISQQLGLREQLEVISIINPTASIQPADTQFVIELNWLTESKLQRVRDYLERHQRSTSKSNSHRPNGGFANSSEAPTVTKRQKRRGQREVHQRDLKEERQVKKEVRSGLFKQEEVVALSNCDPDGSDEEIDILT